MTAKKLGFGGQWVEIFRAGTHPDSEGVKRALDASFLERVVQNFKPDIQEVPITAGSPIHPPDDAPAFGLTAQVRLDGDSLLAQFSDVDPELEDLVKTKKLVSRSASFYLDPPRLKHVHFLGVSPASVKSLKRIHFSEGTTVDVQVDTAITFSEGEKPVTDDEKKALQEEARKGLVKTITDALGITKDETKSASFSAADAKALVENAITEAVKPLNEKITSLEAEKEELKTQVAGIGTKTSRAELVSFCETLEKAGTLPRAFRNMGGVGFLEVLASVPANKKVATIEFAEESVNGVKQQVEKKKEIAPLDFMKSFLSAMRYVQFGESFSDIRLNGDGSDVTNPGEMDILRGEIGLPKSTDKAKA